MTEILRQQVLPSCPSHIPCDRHDHGYLGEFLHGPAFKDKDFGIEKQIKKDFTEDQLVIILSYQGTITRYEHLKQIPRPAKEAWTATRAFESPIASVPTN